jgi:hypothetical protein
MNSIKEKVSDFDFYHCIKRKGYVFTAIDSPANVLDAIVIRNPESCNCWSPRKSFSDHSLKENIELVNKYKLDKAIIIAEDIRFITQCPSLKYIEIVPADTAGDGFDYSPLYGMSDIEYLNCATAYGGATEENTTIIDYSYFVNLKSLHIVGEGHLNYWKCKSLEMLDMVNETKQMNLCHLEKCEKLKKISCENDINNTSKEYDYTYFNWGSIDWQEGQKVIMADLKMREELWKTSN